MEYHAIYYAFLMLFIVDKRIVILYNICIVCYNILNKGEVNGETASIKKLLF